MTCSSGFSRRSVGYVGFSDGWQDLMHNFKMDWQFRSAPNGNIALTGEIDLPDSGEFTIAVALGRKLPEQCHEIVSIAGRAMRKSAKVIVRQMSSALFLKWLGQRLKQFRAHCSGDFSRPSATAIVNSRLYRQIDFAGQGDIPVRS